MPKTAIITTIWKRPEVTRLWCENMTIAASGATIIMVGSEGSESKSIADDYGFHYVEYKNHPLGAKYNAGFHEARRLKMELVGILGSDNIICGKYLEFIQRQDRDFIGHMDSYRMDIITGRAMYWAGNDGKRKGEPVGSGRFFSSRLLNAMDWKPYRDDKNTSLDFFSWNRIRSKRHSFKLFNLRKEKIYHAGMKSDFDKNKYDCIQGYRMDFQEIAQQFPQPEMIVNYGRKFTTS